jgi:hypothetical protein
VALSEAPAARPPSRITRPPTTPDACRTHRGLLKAGLKDGGHVIGKGPTVDNAGKEVLAEGKSADDEWLGGIEFYVKGVEGRCRGGEGGLPQPPCEALAAMASALRVSHVSCPWRRIATRDA